MIQYVVYYRVSTTRQGISGLGLSAQRESVTRFLNGVAPIAEFTEIESGKRCDRKELHNAIALCRQHGYTLLCSRLDRLGRRASFLMGLRDSGIKFTAVDMPFLDNFTCGVMALVAQKEAELCSIRTREALARSSKQKGNPRPEAALRLAVEANKVKADAFARDLAPIIEQIRRDGHVTSLRGLATALNARGFKTSNQKQFSAQTVKNLVQRMS